MNKNTMEEIKGIEEKIENKRLQIEKACHFYAEILENLTDEGSMMQDGDTLYITPLDKMIYLLDGLKELKKELEKLSYIEAFIEDGTL